MLAFWLEIQHPMVVAYRSVEDDALPATPESLGSMDSCWVPIRQVASHGRSSWEPFVPGVAGEPSVRKAGNQGVSARSLVD